MLARTAVLVGALVLGTAGSGFAADLSLYERNHAVLLASLPEGAVLEVSVARDGAWAAELWTAEQYASFRAGVAATLGRDYAAGPAEGVPSGSGEHQLTGDIALDGWGTTRVNVGVSRGLLRSIAVDDKLWLHGGNGAMTGVIEHEGACVVVGGFIFCGLACGWSYPQVCFAVDDCWLAGSGIVFRFPPPFGGVVRWNGYASCTGPG